ncbi:MAG: thioredoxin [Deltaproteobacteria bacterium]|nr:thioredoxin [Deltaproteobacteria bacterium]MCL5276776.1 thioredoxin [Deltaproteobacteria bacterium]
MGDTMLTVTDDNFEKEVLKADRPVLLDFWAEWCMPCKMIEPSFRALSEQYESKIKFGRLNTDDNPRTPTQYNIMGIPTIILFKDGKIVDQIVGAVPKSNIEKMVNKIL